MMRNETVINRNGLRFKIVGIMCLMLSMCLTMVLSNEVFAEVKASRATVDKNLLQGLYACYENKTLINNFDSLEGYKSAGDLLKENANNTKARLITGVESFRFNTSKGSTVGCKILFEGDKNGSNKGIFTSFGKESMTDRNSVDDIADFMTGMGYDVVEKAEKHECYRLRFSWLAGAISQQGMTNRICLNSDGTGLVDDGGSEAYLSARLTVSDGGKEVCLNLTGSSSSMNSTESHHIGCKTLNKTSDFSGEWLKGVIYDNCNGMVCNAGGGYSYTFDSSISDSTDDMSTGSLKDYSANFSNYTLAANKAISYLSDGEFTNKDSLMVKGLEKRLLYQAYLTDYYNVTVDCSGNRSEHTSDGKISWFDISDASMKECNIIRKQQKNAGQPVNGVDKYGFFTKQIDNLDALIKAIDGLEKSYSDEEIQEAMDNYVAAGAEVDESDTNTCASAGGAGSLGWIVCPIMEWLSSTSNGIYGQFVEPSLQIDVQLFSAENDATANAWSNFRDMANVVFMIVLLVVIFSQLTGVGIDNYGIKKILPKLIVMAVLINISYVVCLLAVDISNILGNSIQSIFDGMSNSLTMPNSLTVASDTGAVSVDTSGVTGLTGVGILALLAVGGMAIWMNPAVLICLLVSAIGVFISVFFLFILLAARKAAIVAMVVMSPLAVVMYALPNTKKTFDKWLKLFEGILLVYPISGLLVGAGGYVSKLLIATNDGTQGFLYAFTSIIVSIIPVFFIPTVLKGAFSAMGQIGGRIAGMGAAASQRATNAMRNSGAYKNAQQSGLERQARIRGGLDENGNPVSGARRGLATVLSGGRRNRQRNALQYQKMLSERGSLDATEGENFMLGVQADNIMKSLQATGEINNIGNANEDEENPSGLAGGLYNALRSGNRAEIVAYTNALSAKGEDGRNAVRAAYNRAVNRNEINGASATTFANNILSNHAADYKNNSRSLFAVAQQINQGGRAQSVERYLDGHRAELAGKVTATTIGNMDDAAFNDLFSSEHSPDGFSNAVGAAAYTALHDQNANIKVGRREELQRIVDNSSYEPEVRQVDLAEDGRGYAALNDLNAGLEQELINTGNAAVAAASAAANAGRTAMNTGDLVTNSRQIVDNTRRTAQGVRQNVQATQQVADNTSRPPVPDGYRDTGSGIIIPT